eukprot:gb/GEZJ01001542.1/.p1 GENE.gb/GEZJ01001542.1/~~gb/GEZJ01001542.1/.p1  ORF type:complete len:253 (-),score=36.71 gb/GEZJ01001542.1/:1120-1878(-)
MGRLRAFISTVFPRFVRSQRNIPRCSLQKVFDVANTAVLHARTTSSGKQITLSDVQLSELAQTVAAMNAEDLVIERKRFIDEANDCEDHESVVYVPVAENENCTLAVFVIPPGRSIPLHDHPHMYVVSRVLWGELEVNAYDIHPSDSANLPNGHLYARETGPQVIPSDQVKSLTPTSNNVHAFSTSEWTAVFDVLLPPYNAEQRRDCTYYEVLLPGESQQHAKANVILKKTPCPDAFRTVASDYLGVEVQIN